MKRVQLENAENQINLALKENDRLAEMNQSQASIVSEQEAKLLERNTSGIDRRIIRDRMEKDYQFGPSKEINAQLHVPADNHIAMEAQMMGGAVAMNVLQQGKALAREHT